MITVDGVLNEAGLRPAAIKSLSVIFFFLLAFVNNQINEIDLLTPGQNPVRNLVPDGALPST